MKLTKTSIAGALQTIRAEVNPRQAEFGKRIGLTSGGMSKIESGQRLPSVRVLLEWVDQCGYDLRVVPKSTEGTAVLEIGSLPEGDQEALRILVRRLPELGEIQRAMILAQVDVLAKTGASPSEEPSDTFVKSPRGGVG